MLDERKIKVAELRAQGKNKSEIAREAGISRPTIREWLKDPEVIKLVEDEKQDIIEAARNHCASNSLKYIEETEDIAFHSEDARSKLSALQSLTDRAMGKVAQRIETNEPKEENITDDMIEQAINDADNNGKSNEKINEDGKH